MRYDRNGSLVHITMALLDAWPQSGAEVKESRRCKQATDFGKARAAELNSIRRA